MSDKASSKSHSEEEEESVEETSSGEEQTEEVTSSEEESEEESSAASSSSSSEGEEEEEQEEHEGAEKNEEEGAAAEKPEVIEAAAPPPAPVEQTVVEAETHEQAAPAAVETQEEEVKEEEAVAEEEEVKEEEAPAAAAEQSEKSESEAESESETESEHKEETEEEESASDEEPAPAPVAAAAAAAPVVAAASGPDTRSEVVALLLKEERAYSKKLNLFDDVYYTPLMKSHRRILTQEECKVVYNDLNVLAANHRDLVKSIEERYHNWGPESTIGELLFQKIGYFRKYASYAEQFSESMKAYGKAKKHNIDFRTFIENSSKDSRLGGTDAMTYLVLPFHQIKTYLPLLEGINNRTDDSHKDKTPLNNVIAELNQVIAKVSEKSTEVNMIQQLIDLNQKIKGNTESIVDPSRRLMRQGEVTQLIGSKTEPRVILLFNDLMIVGSKTGENIHFAHSIDLTVSLVTSLPNEDKSFRFKVEDADNSLTFAVPTDAEKQTWMKLLMTANDKIVDMKKEGYTLKMRKEKLVILDTGLKDTAIVDELLKKKKDAQITVINISKRGREKWPRGIEVVNCEISNTTVIKRHTLGASAIHLVLKPPFNDFPDLLLKAVEHCFQPIQYTTALGSVIDQKKTFSVLILDKKK